MADTVTMYGRDGKPVAVPSDQVATAYRSGQLGFAEGQTIGVDAPEGLKEVDAVEAMNLLAQPLGEATYGLESEERKGARKLQEQYGGVLPTLGGAGLAGLSGATIGLSDVAGSIIGGEGYREFRHGTEEASPYITGGAEVAGTILPLLASGGTSAAAKGAAAVGAPIRAATGAGRIAEHAIGALATRVGLTGESIAGAAIRKGLQYGVGGAVEGAIVGAGQGLSEAALAPGGNFDQVGEKVLAGMAHGAEFLGMAGGAFGAMTGVVGRGGERLIEKLSGGRGVRGLAEDVSEKAAVKAINPSKKASRELVNTGRMNQTGKELLDHDIIGIGRGTEEMLEKATAVNAEAGEKIGGLMRQLDEAGAVVDAAKVLRRNDDQILKLRKSLSKADQRIADKLEDTVSVLRDRAKTGQIGFEDLHGFRSRLDADIKWAQIEAPPAARALRDLRGGLEGELESQAEAAFSKAGLGDDFLKQYRSAKSTYGATAWAKKQLTDNLARGQVNRTFGLTDTIAGSGLGNIGTMVGLASGSIPLAAVSGMATAAAGGLANKIVREHGASVIARLGRRAATSQDRAILALAGNARKVEDRVEAAVVKFFRGTREHAWDVGRPLTEKAHAAQAPQQPHAPKSHVDAALGIKKGDDRVDAYMSKLRQIADANARGPAAIQERIGTVATHAPQVAVGMAAALARGNQYLMQSAPVGLTDPQAFMPQTTKPQVDPTALAKWARKLQIVENPLTVVDELEQGTITKDHVEALRVVYPQLYEDIRGKVMKQVMNAEKPLPYEKRITLGTLLDLPTDKSLRPESIKHTQDMHAASQVAEAPPAPMPAAVSERSKSFQLTPEALDQ